MAHLAVLVHEHARFDSPNYVLYEVAKLWQEQGHTVVPLQGIARYVPADLLFIHVDLTIVPPDYLEFASRYPRVANPGPDISKHRVSTNLVRRHDGYAGPVIVKTNRNYGGKKEAELEAHTSKLRRRVRRVRNLLPWPYRSELPTEDYKIFNSPHDVPWPVWHNPWLVVERFLPERRGELYCLRTWNFLGSGEVNFLRTCPDPVIKASRAGQREPVGPVPDLLRQRREELGLDMGKFDYAIVDGEPVVYDANRTPTIALHTDGRFLPIFQALARGLDSLLERAPRQLPPPAEPSGRYNCPI